MTIASHKTRIFSAAAILVADVLFFTTTNATSVVSVELVLAFGLAVVSLYLLFNQLLVLISLYGLPFKQHHKRIAVMITGVVAVVLALLTVGEFTTRDIMVITPMILLGAAYMIYGRGRKTSSQ